MGFTYEKLFFYAYEEIALFSYEIKNPAGRMPQREALRTVQ